MAPYEQNAPRFLHNALRFAQKALRYGKNVAGFARKPPRYICSKRAGTFVPSRGTTVEYNAYSTSASYGNVQAQSPALDLWSLATEGTQERTSRPQAGVQPFGVGINIPSLAGASLRYAPCL